MALRQPPTGLRPLALDAIAASATHQWHNLDYILATPMYGGGVDAHTVDEKMPIRASAIRGQLRFWWRLLATHCWKLGNTNAIRKAEFALWGGMGDKDPLASKVLLKVASTNKPVLATYEGDVKSWADVAYALFPAQGSTRRGHEKDPDILAKAGLTWQLSVQFAKNKPLHPKKPDFNPNITEKEEDQVWQALRWWSCFGGVGARTRRGLGAVQLLKTSNGVPSILLKAITAEEAKAAGCELLLKNSSVNAYSAWQTAVNKLRDFRQKPDLGRNVGQQANRPGRSRWPEPDAIRRLTRTHLQSSEKTHAHEHKAGNIFPRAAFGLPIIFKFKDDNVRGARQNDPAQLSLNPCFGTDIGDRMASPIILRPVRVGEKWAAGALLLPHAHIDTLELALGTNHLNLTHYDEQQAEHIPAIAQNGGTTPLQAFMTYFAK